MLFRVMAMISASLLTTSRLFGTPLIVWHTIDDRNGAELVDVRACSLIDPSRQVSFLLTLCQTFNVFLGGLTTGDMVYVAVGPRTVCH
jgi:hypothetical protein